MLVKIVAHLLAVFLAVTNADHVGAPGAPVNADINNPEVQEALRFAMAQYNSQSDSMYISQVVRVICVQMQVVAGVKYIFTIEIARTSCVKGNIEYACSLNSDPAIAQLHVCRFAVWSQPWKSCLQLVENTC